MDITMNREIYWKAEYGVKTGLIAEEDRIYTMNRLMELFKLEDIKETPETLKSFFLTSPLTAVILSISEKRGVSCMNENTKRVIKEIGGWVLTILIAVLAAKLINEKVIIKAEVPTASMENNIMVDDCILGFQLAYTFSDPKRGDIVIFPWPDNPEVTYVKRIIGLPGETLEVKNGSVYINGTPLKEDYLKEPMTGEYGPYEVPEDSYFMMGDNRNPSLDSRKWKNTYLKREDIIAKVLFRYSPNFTWFSGVKYE